ncbi:hypothetical protein ANN_21078 [Periplaneta americana]|uniref:Uncharacterized protein n=1 Tax=Periplaneta americana TaxID=6978 RepID=A0ABQ8SED2_PERAM|nr:hypothetical protein ANN_21078 [Periplaneta americana]
MKFWIQTLVHRRKDSDVEWRTDVMSWVGLKGIPSGDGRARKKILCWREANSLLDYKLALSMVHQRVSFLLLGFGSCQPNVTHKTSVTGSPDIIRNIKSRRLRWAGHVALMGESRNAYRVLVGRPEGKKPLGRLRRSWEDNIKMDLREVGYDGRDWINLAQDRDQWRQMSRLEFRPTSHGRYTARPKVKISEDGTCSSFKLYKLKQRSRVHLSLLLNDYRVGKTDGA